MPRIDTLFGFKPVDDAHETDYEIRKIKASKIVVLPQVRTNFDDESIEELATSIKEIGLQEPLTVRSDLRGEVFTLVNGERRYRALKLIHGDNFMDTLVECKIYQRDMDGDTVELIQMADNVVRKDLSLLEQAQAIKRLYEKGFMVDRIAQALGTNRTRISKVMALASMPERFLKLFDYSQDFTLLYSFKTLTDKYTSDEIETFARKCIEDEEITRAGIAALRKKLEGGDKKEQEETAEINGTAEEAQSLQTDEEQTESLANYGHIETDASDDYDDDSDQEAPVQFPVQSPSQTPVQSFDEEDESYGYRDDEDEVNDYRTEGEKETKKTYGVSKLLWYDKDADKLVCLLDNGQQVEVTASQIKVKL